MKKIIYIISLIILSGFAYGNVLCYQEYANESNYCINETNIGTEYSDGTWTNESYLNDGNWSTFSGGNDSGDSYYYMNYSVDYNSQLNDIVLMFKVYDNHPFGGIGNTIERNRSLRYSYNRLDCYENRNNLSIRIKIVAEPRVYIQCHNGVDWQTLQQYNAYDSLYEFAAIYNISPAITDCTTNLTSTKTINISFNDEITQSNLSTFSNIHLNYWENNFPATKYNNTFNFTNKDNIQLCIYPLNSSFRTNTLFQYYLDDYALRSYYYVNETISNVTRNDNFYSLSTSNSTAINMYLSDKLDNDLKDYYIYLMRKRFEDNTYDVVEISKTDTDGLGRFNVDLYDTIYRFMIKDSGGTLFDLTEDNTIKLTTIYYSIDTDEDYLQKYTDIDGITTYLNIDNSTGVVSFTYTDTSDISASYCLDVYKYNAVSLDTEYSSCLTAKTGTITHTLTDTIDGSYVAKGYIITSGSLDFKYTLIQGAVTYGSEYRTFGEAGVFSIIIWTMSLAFSGAMIAGLSGVVLGSILGIGSGVIMKMISIPWTVLSSVIILGGLIIWKIKR